MTCISLSEFEASRIGFTKILVPRIAEIISIGSPDLIFTFTTAITIIFVPADYINLTCSLEIVGSIDRLIDLLGACEDTPTLANFSFVLAKICEHVNAQLLMKFGKNSHGSNCIFLVCRK